MSAVHISNIFHTLCYTVNIYLHYVTPLLPSVLWRCWLGSRKGIRPVKNMGRMVEVSTG